MAEDLACKLVDQEMCDAIKSSRVEKIVDDVSWIARKIGRINPGLQMGETINLVFEYITSSQKIRNKAIATKTLNPKTWEYTSGGKWEYHFMAFKDCQKQLAKQEHKHNPDLDCDGAWYQAQKILAEEILVGNYKRVEDSSKGL
ncbi:MAG: hypothetical protein ABH840_00550 [Nanoarchaeota archaeon]